MENVLVDNLLNKGKLPEVEVSIKNESVINMAIAIAIAGILILCAYKLLNR